VMPASIVPYGSALPLIMGMITAAANVRRKSQAQGPAKGEVRLTSKPSRGNGRYSSAGRKKAAPLEISHCSYRPRRACLQCNTSDTRTAVNAQRLERLWKIAEAYRIDVSLKVSSITIDLCVRSTVGRLPSQARVVASRQARGTLENVMISSRTELAAWLSALLLRFRRWEHSERITIGQDRAWAHHMRLMRQNTKRP
jgi:hypothetical protein